MNKNFNNTITKSLKSVLTIKTLRENLRNIFRDKQFSNVNYVSMIIRLEKPNKVFNTLGMKFIINIQNKDEVNYYIEYLLNKFQSKFLESYDIERVIQIHCNTYICDENDHKSFRRNINNKKLFTDEIKLGIKPYLNIPFNSSYESWGTTQTISKNEYVITNIHFNNEIDTLKITEHIAYKKIVHSTSYRS